MQHRWLFGILFVNFVWFACSDDDASLIERDTEESRSPARPGAQTASDPSSTQESTPDDVAMGQDPLSSSPEAPSDTASTAPDGTRADSEPSPAQSSDAGPSQPPAEPTPPADADPTTPPLALPDLVLDAAYLEATIQQAVVDASLDSCLINEKCITGLGLRRVVRFGTRSGNIGTADLVAGRPVLENPVWEYDACHDHFHFEGYAQYELIDAVTRSVLPVGVKHGFCLRDLGTWDASVPAGRCGVYDCDYQGLGVGCSDVYVPELDCQWVDITDVAPGEYELRVTINSEERIQELDRSNNSASVRILITPETVRPVP